MVIKIFGGLGNQMFQYAFGRSVSLKNKKKLYLDLFWFDIFGKNQKRFYGLDNFNIKCFKKRSLLFFLFSKYFLKNIIEKESDLYRFNEFFLRTNGYFIGYWQTDKYFSSFRDVIINDFTLKNEISEVSKDFLNNINNCNSVSLHIRRGDYVENKETNNFHGVCDLNYYKDAIKFIKNKVDDPVFFIFSDDIFWAKNNLDGNDNNFIFVSDKNIKDYEEMFLMSKCRHNIIANSSFSWWGAWLNTNIKKTVIAPKKWIKKEGINIFDLIPSDWIKL